MAGTDLTHSSDIIDYQHLAPESVAEHRLEATSAFLAAGTGSAVDLVWDHTGPQFSG